MSVHGLDFSQLSLRDALDLAILIEEEARERYEEFADQMDLHHTPAAAAFFRLMASNEAKHGAQLLEQRVERFGSTPRKVSRDMLWDVEAPDFDQARAFMTPRQAMQAALRSERKAHAFFDAALPQVEDAEVKNLFKELRQEEVAHQALVKAELGKLPPDAPGSPEDFEDEPTAQ
ncbi:MAG TPA: ferritin family protein [Candidatus Acidoferrales bacterium]|nr:ferritin family protein [Candidatus Acidoferrales bacterium]